MQALQPRIVSSQAASPQVPGRPLWDRLLVPDQRVNMLTLASVSEFSWYAFSTKPFLRLEKACRI